MGSTPRKQLKSPTSNLPTLHPPNSSPRPPPTPNQSNPIPVTPRVVPHGETSPVRGPLFAGKSFWIAKRCPARTSVVQLVESNGGQVTKSDKEADYLIVDHNRPDGVKNALSYTFIISSVRNVRLEKPADHCAGPRPGTVRDIGNDSRPRKGGRATFTLGEDKMVCKWVAEAAEFGCSKSGNTIFQLLEQHVADSRRHTWQSWRDRYCKRLQRAPPPDWEKFELPVRPRDLEVFLSMKNSSDQVRPFKRRKIGDSIIQTSQQPLPDDPAEQSLPMSAQTRASSTLSPTTTLSTTLLSTSTEISSSLSHTGNSGSRKVQIKMEHFSAECFLYLFNMPELLEQSSFELSKTWPKLSERWPDYSPDEWRDFFNTIQFFFHRFGDDKSAAVIRQSLKDWIKNSDNPTSSWAWYLKFRQTIRPTIQRRIREMHNAVEVEPAAKTLVSPPSRSAALSPPKGASASVSQNGTSAATTSSGRGKRNCDAVSEESEKSEEPAFASPSPPLPFRPRSSPPPLPRGQDAGETQAVLETETQELDLDMPEPEGGFETPRPEIEAQPGLEDRRGAGGDVAGEEVAGELGIHADDPMAQGSEGGPGEMGNHVEAVEGEGNSMVIDGASYSHAEGYGGAEEEEQQVGIFPEQEGSPEAFERMIASFHEQGYHDEDIAIALQATSADITLTKTLLAALASRTPVPPDVPGVWLPQDDEDLQSGDRARRARVARKHGLTGARGCEGRLEFLRLEEE